MIALIQALGATVLLIIAGGIGWLIKTKHESLKIEREAIRQQLFDSYIIALEPLLKILINVSNLKPKSKNKNEPSLTQQINIPEYRRNAFHLLLFGDDNVVDAWNTLWHELYKNPPTPENMIYHLDRIGLLLVEIRKSLGHPETKVDKRDMFKWLIKDIGFLDFLEEPADKSERLKEESKNTNTIPKAGFR